MTEEERWQLTVRAAPTVHASKLSQVRLLLRQIDEAVGPNLPNYSPMEEQFIDMAWRSMGRPRLDGPKPYDRPPDAPRPGDPQPQPNEQQGFDDYGPTAEDV
jgi:hypothetical protein